ncbi:GNAT family N-acetyltransferase [Jidongwangia harbinensis]|uniref:GNAT family N-acetyltransferase n=1 Tax=Jidongwangia harbinensis TaxID=2878561 RepID=UPI001CD9958F|nr:GNAT family protein [Jidongwangia harbinensis]MCA2213515.1 GNAT family N-acetyltransferase [Jidongwangia harbinensis]
MSTPASGHTGTPGPDLTTVAVYTERFVLRPWRADDLGELAEAAADRYITSITSVPAPFSTEGGHAFLRRMTELAAGGVAVPRAIADRATGVVVGHVSLRLRDLDLGRIGLGYWILPAARGRGAAAEAVSGFTGWAFDRLGAERAELCVEPWNEPSKRVALRAGFVREGLLRSFQVMGGQRCDVEMFARIRPPAPPRSR